MRQRKREELLFSSHDYSHIFYGPSALPSLASLPTKAGDTNVAKAMPTHPPLQYFPLSQRFFSRAFMSKYAKATTHSNRLCTFHIGNLVASSCDVLAYFCRHKSRGMRQRSKAILPSSPQMEAHWEKWKASGWSQSERPTLSNCRIGTAIYLKVKTGKIYTFLAEIRTLLWRPW